MNFKGLAFGLGLVGAAAQAKVQVTLVPGIQFVRQGGSVQLKARVRGHRHDPGLAWSIVAPGPGSLASADMGRVRYVADGVEPWSRVQVRVTSLEDPERHADAVIEVLPSEAFGVLEQVLGPGWIETGAERPAPVRMDIKEPGWFSWSGSYTFSGEVDSFERDRFAWAVHPGIGRLSRVATGDRSRDTVRFEPPAGQHQGYWSGSRRGIWTILPIPAKRWLSCLRRVPPSCTRSILVSEPCFSVKGCGSNAFDIRKGKSFRAYA